MLGNLLTSKPKANLINMFLAHPGRAFTATELKIAAKCPAKLLASTLKELSKMEFLRVAEKKRKKFYQINKHFALYPELVNMLRKVRKLPPDLLAKAASKAGDCKLIALTGLFVGRPRVETDVLFVGKITPRRLVKFLKLATKFAEQEVSFTVFAPHEFEYRKIMNDRFVKNILENNPVLVVDKTRTRSIAKLVYKL